MIFIFRSKDIIYKLKVSGNIAITHYKVISNCNRKNDYNHPFTDL